MRLHRRGLDSAREAELLSGEATLDDARYPRAIRAAIGRDRPSTNQVEMCLEERKPLSGEGDAGIRCEVTKDDSGSNRFSWHLGGPVKAGAGFSYTNRFGLAFGHLRQNDNAIGQRIAHWQEGNANLMTYPSDSAIEAMAECGVSLCVLHLYWYAWPAYNIFDEQDMRRWIASCHERGIKCAVYVSPTDKAGINGINPEWVQGLDLVLVTAANLGEGCEPVLSLDSELLGLGGSYRLMRLSGPDITRFAATDAGEWRRGTLALGRMETDDYLGMLMVRGEMPEHTSRELARIQRTCSSSSRA